MKTFLIFVSVLAGIGWGMIGWIMWRILSLDSKKVSEFNQEDDVAHS